jgi:membrane protein implicated in regulation of membrane protease activity
MNELIGLGTLDCIYFFLFALGVGYAIIAGLLGSLSHIDLPGMDIDIPGVDLHPGEPDIHLDIPFIHDISHDVDHHEVGLSPLSPITIATFITTFGGVGLIVSNLTPFPPVLGLLIATVSGLALSAMIFLLYTRVFAAVQGSSEVQSGDLVGLTGQVSAPIPKDNVGEVVVVARGARMRSTARSADGNAIPRGTTVEIVEEAGNAVIVRPKKVDTDR